MWCVVGPVLAAAVVVLCDSASDTLEVFDVATDVTPEEMSTSVVGAGD